MSKFNNMYCCKLSLQLILVAIITAFSLSVNAAWFAATGQAAILNDDKEAARHQATQEAIKQALLFAGASVRSVQQMTNGLLMDDHLEIRSSGEVSSIELMDEVYANGTVTVSIRADIFSQESKCSAADYTKRIATTYFPIEFPAQSADGQIHKLGEALSKRFKSSFNSLTTSMNISNLQPYIVDWTKTDVSKQSKNLANQTNTQYVLTVVLNDISISREPQGRLSLWSEADAVRNFGFELQLVNGATGEVVIQKTYRTAAQWNYSLTESVDVNSEKFWQSAYGKAISEGIQRAVLDLEEQTMCEPTMGRILAVANNQLQINLGRNQKVQAGDQLTLFTVKEIEDNFGQSYRQFMLHPTPLVVSQVFAETSTVTSADNSLLANIQSSDYVARQ